ncbi:hypothetical protein GF324_13875 [bacterium]|nr:hypothetical protein [bacterium]
MLKKDPEKVKAMMEQWGKRQKKPIFVRANDYKRVNTANYIIRRNEHGGAVYVVGKAHRRLPTDVDVKHALKMGKNVAQWGSKFFLYSPVHPEDARPVLEEIWEADEKRGIPRPEYSYYDREEFEI